MENVGGIIGVKIKIMPESPKSDLEQIKALSMEIIKKEGGINKEYYIEPIAFGLNAVIAFFQWPEEKPLENIENKLKKIKQIKSIEIIDLRKIA